MRFLEGTPPAFTCQLLADDFSDCQSNDGNTQDNVVLHCRMAATQIIPDKSDEATQLFLGNEVEISLMVMLD